MLIVDTYLQPAIVLVKRGRLSMRFERQDGFGDQGCHWAFCRETTDDEIWITPWARLPEGDRWVSHPNRSVRDAGTVEISVPLWVLISATAVMPLAALARRRLRIAARVGACAFCGYDLRATPERCPECGKVPSAAKVKA
jgi:hypothetical protein